MGKQTSRSWQHFNGTWLQGSSDFSNEPLCGTHEAARYLGVSVGTVHNLVDRGELQAIRTGGGHRRISRDSLLAYRKRKEEGDGGLGHISWVIISTREATRSELMQIAAAFDVPIRLRVCPSLGMALLVFRELQPSVIFIECMPNEQEAKECASIAMNAYHSDALWVLLTQESSQEAVHCQAETTGALLVLSRCAMEAWVRGYLSACAQLSIRNKSNHDRVARMESTPSALLP